LKSLLLETAFAFPPNICSVTFPCKPRPTQ
jgi:hypothetical protein